jgi:SNF2 family DNA or RNA helicase
MGLENACVALWVDPGLGKTAIILAIFKILKRQKMVKRMLVVSPLRPAHLVWPAELKKWTDFEALKMTVLHGDDKNKLLNEDAEIFVINFEGLDWLMAEDRFKKLKIDMLVVDESSRVKNTQSKRFKLLKKVLHTFKRRYTLTGSPAPNGYMDVFGQIYVTDMGRSLGQYITKFRSEYFDPCGYMGYDWKIKPDGEKRIQERVRPIVLSLQAEDYIDMPTEVPNDVFIDLPPAAMKMYKEMEGQLITSISSRESVSAKSYAAALIKCQQIANGGLYRDAQEDENALLRVKEKRTWIDIHNMKCEAVEEIVNELAGKPALIAYNFEHDLARLQKTFGKDVPCIGGGTSTKRAIELERMWNQGQLPVLLGHPASMGHGLNLQKSGNTIIWHSLTHDFELYDQFNRRIRRQGSKHATVVIHRIIARNTVDQFMAANLSRKETNQRGLVAALRTFYAPKRKGGNTR